MFLNIINTIRQKYLNIRIIEYSHKASINPITHPSFTLMFCITSNPCGPSSDAPIEGFDVRDDIKLGLSIALSNRFIILSLLLSLSLSSLVADNAEVVRFGRQFGTLSSFPI